MPHPEGQTDEGGYVEAEVVDVELRFQGGYSDACEAFVAAAVDYDDCGLLGPACGGLGHGSAGVDWSFVSGCLGEDFGVGVDGYHSGCCGGKAEDS